MFNSIMLKTSVAPDRKRVRKGRRTTDIRSIRRRCEDDAIKEGIPAVEEDDEDKYGKEESESEDGDEDDYGSCDEAQQSKTIDTDMRCLRILTSLGLVRHLRTSQGDYQKTVNYCDAVAARTSSFLRYVAGEEIYEDSNFDALVIKILQESHRSEIPAYCQVLSRRGFKPSKLISVLGYYMCLTLRLCLQKRLSTT